MSDNLISQFYANVCRETWVSRGYHVEHFEAITPKHLKDCNELQFTQKEKSYGNFDFSLTEKSIWYSHFYLWQKCLELNEPIVIIEHDCYLIDYIPDNIDTKVYFFTLTVHKRRPGVAPAAGYIITPQFAQELVTLSQQESINVNVDGELLYRSGQNQNQPEEDMVAYQYIEHEIGTTIEH